MKIFIFVLFSFFIASPAFSQQNFFVYVQTDNKQPFYIKLNNKVFSSSSTGYAIIPKLPKGDYLFSVGFPKNEYPLQNINLSVNEDAGYLLKDFGEKGWGFFNMQTLGVVMAGNAKKMDVASVTTAAPATTGSTTEPVPVLLKTTPVIVKKDAAVKSDPVEIPLKVEKVQVIPSETLQTISKLTSSMGPLGRTISYIDKGESPADTVIIFIAVNEQIAIAPQQAKANKPNGKEEKFLDIEMSNPNSLNDSAGRVNAQVGQVVTGTLNASKTASVLRPLTINSDCKAIASENDFLKLRKRMASETSEDRMIAAARKLFKIKCYSTEQVKNLASLFLKDSGKYNFFDAAYPFISDTQNFNTLESQLNDPYYITRFKAMIRN